MQHLGCRVGDISLPWFCDLFPRGGCLGCAFCIMYLVMIQMPSCVFSSAFPIVFICAECRILHGLTGRSFPRARPGLGNLGTGSQPGVISGPCKL